MKWWRFLQKSILPIQSINKINHRKTKQNPKILLSKMEHQELSDNLIKDLVFLSSFVSDVDLLKINQIKTPQKKRKKINIELSQPKRNKTE